MIKFLKIFLIINCMVAGVISTGYVLGCFITWTIIPVWTLEDISSQTFRIVEVALACISFLFTLDMDSEL